MRVCNARNVSALVIAITACSAKVLSSSICVTENSPGMLRPIAMAPTGAPLRSNGTATTARTVAPAFAEVIRINEHVWHLHHVARNDRPSERARRVHRRGN